MPADGRPGRGVRLLLPGRARRWDRDTGRSRPSCRRVRVCPVMRRQPPYEVLAALVASLRHELAGAAGALEQARAELAQARERITIELEARLRQNPRNSSRPPSSEGLAKPAPKPRSLRKKSGRRPGGQDGHNGTTLAQVARPDREIRHEPGCCGRCGAGLAGRPVTGVERRQVFDLQPVRYRGDRAPADRAGMRLRAPHQGRGPARRGGPGAVRAADRRGHRLPVRRAVPVQGPHRAGLAELFGIPLSSGTVAALTARAAGRLDGFAGARPRADRRQRRRRVRRDRVPGGGRLAWVHCARTGKYTLLMAHPRRGRQAIEAMGILPRFAGVAVHDAWAPYDTYASPGHQLCCSARPARRTAGRHRCRPRREMVLGRTGRRSPHRDARTWCARRSATDTAP